MGKLGKQLDKLLIEKIKETAQITDKYQKTLKNHTENYIEELEKLQKKNKFKEGLKAKLDWINAIITPILFLIIVYYLFIIWNKKRPGLAPGL